MRMNKRDQVAKYQELIVIVICIFFMIIIPLASAQEIQADDNIPGEIQESLEDSSGVFEDESDLKSALVNANDGTETLALYGAFANGSWNTTIFEYWKTWRISTTAAISLNRDVVLVPATGYEFYLWYWADGGVTGNSGWKNLPFGVTAGQEFNIIIRKLSEDTSEYTADINEFVNAVTFTTVLSDKIDAVAASIGALTDVRVPDSAYTLTGKLLNSGGTGVASMSNYNSTDYISINDINRRAYGKAFPSTYYNSFVLYDVNKTPIYMAHGDFDINLSVDFPAAKYYRASYDTNNPNDYYVYFGPEITENRVFTVGAGQMYSTLRGGIEAAVKYDGATVVVYPGTYDLTSEYATEISAATGQVGIELANNVYVKFLAGSYVKALFPTSSEWINTYFQPFRGRDFTLDGLNIEASNCRYCVHDEMNGTDVKYHNVYKNCIMKYTRTADSGVTGTVYGQCIGGGLGKYGYIEVIGGKYTSIIEASAGFDMPCISYHNGSTAGCDSKIFIRDVYLDGTNGILRFGYYGTSTIKSQVLVSGCSMGGAIQHVAETSGSAVDNFEVTEWNNIIRN